MSLKQIAEMTGTSVSTVSRVLNQSSSTCASKALQDKIWAAAREIGYQPNQAARALKQGQRSRQKPPQISVVSARVSAEEDPFFAELFRSLEVSLLKQNAMIHVIAHAEAVSSSQLAKSDGVIIIGRCSHELLSRILRKNKNVVGIWRNSMNFDIDEVICDGQKAAELAMSYLFSLGHKKIAYIGDCSYESRYVGYCNFLFHSQIPVDYSLIRQTNQTKEETEAAFLGLLEQKRTGNLDFTAIFCANDNTALHVLKLLRRQKPNVRRSISVISIDDIQEAQNTKPYLTTIHIPHQEMAHLAVKLLLDRISRGHMSTVRIEFPCRLVCRDSCYQI